MVDKLAASLEFPLSRERLENFRPEAGSDLEMVVNYLFNVELPEALCPSLHAFEVALRNSIHSAFTQHFGTEFWLDTQGLYPSPPPSETFSWQERALQAARAKLTAHGKPMMPAESSPNCTWGTGTVCSTVHLSRSCGYPTKDHC